MSGRTGRAINRVNGLCAAVSASALFLALAFAPGVAVAQDGAHDSLSTSILGKGTPVVIVPGVLGSAYSFRKVIPELVANDFRVAVVDPLGFGASARPDRADYSFSAQAARLATAIDRLGMRKVILVCHALSGTICLRLAYHHPEMVRAIVSINGGASEQAGTTEMRVAVKLARVVLFVMGRNFAFQHLRKGLIESSGDTAWVTDTTVSQYIAPFGTDARRVVRSLEQIVDAKEAEPLAPNLPRVQAPVLLLFGPVTRNPKDPALTDAERAVLRSGLRRFEEADVQGAGEYIQEEQPAQVIAAVRKVRAESR